MELLFDIIDKQEELNKARAAKKEEEKKRGRDIPPVIVGVTGVAGSGKSTFTDLILKITSEDEVEELAFATPLKKAAMELFVFKHKDVYDPKLKEVVDPRWGKSPRQILQWLGSEVLRDQFDKDFLIKNLEHRIEASGASIIIVSDVRFDNEAEFVKSHGGILVRITRPSLAKKEGEVHQSEKGVKDEYITHEIVNDGTMDDFEKKIIDFCKSI